MSVSLSSYKPNKLTLLTAMATAMVITSGCQSLKTASATTPPTLVSEKTGTLTANDPETLLKKATGWQAPISQMPYWISGRPAPSDSAPQLDAQNRLVSSVNGEWNASFTYKGDDKLPSKISAVRSQGNKVVMTINH